MNVFDALILLAILAAAVGGYRLGFVVRGLSWLGLGLGLFLAMRFLPGLIHALRPHAVPTQLLLVAVLLLVAGAAVGQLLGLAAATHLRVHVKAGPVRRADQVAGAAAGVVGVLVAVWLLAPAMASLPGWSAREARNSALARHIEDWFPNAPDGSRALQRLVGAGYPDVFDALRPAPSVGPPPAASGLSAATATRVAASTVKIVGDACQLTQEGSGFVVGDGLVATNAHVVAGEPTTVVQRSDGVQLRADVVVFDPDRDLALLSVDGLDRPPLPIGTSAQGQRGGVFGHPGGGPLTISPFSIDANQPVVGNDIYGQGQVRRQVLYLASDLAPGDSGGALVTPQGTVVGVAFAIAPDRPGVAYALSTSELNAALTQARHRVSTGPCTTD